MYSDITEKKETINAGRFFNALTSKDSPLEVYILDADENWTRKYPHLKVSREYPADSSKPSTIFFTIEYRDNNTNSWIEKTAKYNSDDEIELMVVRTPTGITTGLRLQRVNFSSNFTILLSYRKVTVVETDVTVEELFKLSEVRS